MADIAFEKDLSVTETGIGGLKVVDLAVHGDSRGWFKENWQRAKMTALGIPDLKVVQNNISYNDSRGVTRGIHAEPWGKFISVARGSVFGAWVDLREGSETFGKVYTCTLDPSRAIYVPRGVGNSFQALEDGTAYTYLVDAHWSLELKRTYTFVNLADPELAIEWPIPLAEATVSEADLNHPMLKDVVPMAPKRTLVTGCNGQLGHAVRALAEERGVAKDFDFCDIDTFDMSDPDAYAQYDWSLYGTVINCGAYTAVDRAETPEGRVAAWKANATGPALLARTCAGHGITLVHVSSDYVFDGTAEVHDEEEPLSPLSVYGQTKAAGDIAVAGCPRHYIMRSSWVIGEGHNFVKTMKALSDRVADPEDKLTCWRTRPPTAPTAAPAAAASPPGPKSRVRSSRPPTATAARWSRSLRPTTTPAPPAPSHRARSTPRSTCPSWSPQASTCPTGRKSWGSTSRRSSRS